MQLVQYIKNLVTMIILFKIIIIIQVLMQIYIYIY